MDQDALESKVPDVSAQLYKKLQNSLDKARKRWHDMIAAELAKHIPFRFLCKIPQSLHPELLVVFTKVNDASDADVLRNACVILEKYTDADKEFIDWFADEITNMLKDSQYHIE